MHLSKYDTNYCLNDIFGICQSMPNDLNTIIVVMAGFGSETKTTSHLYGVEL